jgi:hypothetical protein
LKTSFDLARVKINNKTTFDIAGVKIEKNLSADLVDMSFIRSDDTKSLNIHKKISDLNCEEWQITTLDYITIPFLSPHYLFYDLCNMLVEEGIFPWTDKKYEKRLKRLFLMGLTSSFLIDSSTSNQLTCLNTLHNILVSIDTTHPNNNVAFLNNITPIRNKVEIETTYHTNVLTHNIIKSLYNMIICHKFLNAITLTNQEQTYLNQRLVYVFADRSDHGPLSTFINTPFDSNEFNKYKLSLIDMVNNMISLLDGIQTQSIILDIHNIKSKSL